MVLHLTPTYGEELRQGRPPLIDATEKAAAAAKTIELWVEHGYVVPEGTEEDAQTAEKLVYYYAEDPENVSKYLTHTRIGSMTTAALRALDAQLRAFSDNIVENSTQIRNYVTNKLIEESENPDPRIRMKALELLGKISDVGLFADKTEVTVTHQTSDELRDALKARLAKLTGADPVTTPTPPEGDIIDAEVVEEPPKKPDLLDIWD